MDCPQSLLRHLLSQPREEAFKLIDSLRASQAGTISMKKGPSHDNNEVMHNNSLHTPFPIIPSNHLVDIPSYDQIFKPPPSRLREKNKLYGKAYLRRHYPDQLRILNGNYSIVRKWFEKNDSFGDLRNNPKEKQKIETFIREKRIDAKESKREEIQDIVLHGATYTWLDEDIYTWIIKSLQAKRKNMKKKSITSTLFDGERDVDGEGDDDGDNEEIDDEGTNKLVTSGSITKIASTMENQIEHEFSVGDNLEAHNKDVLGGSSSINLKKHIVSCYRPEITWEQPQDTYPIYEEYQALMKESELVECLEEVNFDATQNFKNNMKDMSLCPSEKEVDASRKSVRKRKLTSKLEELIKKKDKVHKVSKKKKWKDTLCDDGDSNASTYGSIKKQGKDFSTGDQETIVMKWLTATTVEEMYRLLKSTYFAMRKVEGFYCRKTSDLSSVRMLEDMVSWLLHKSLIKIKSSKVGPLSLSDVEIACDE